MKFGVSLAPKVDDLGFVSHLERLEFDTAWFSESHLYWSDPIACAAIAATQTKKIQIGVGILAAGIRLAPVTAAATATICRIAPNRTMLGIGRGTTSWRTMGHPQLPQAEFVEYLRVTRALLDGEPVEFHHNDRASEIWLESAQLGFVDTDVRVPMAVCGLDDQFLWAARSYGDAIVEGMNVTRDDAAQVIAGKHNAAGAYDPLGVCVWTHAIVLEPGEDLDADRVKAEAGPLVLERLHEFHAQMSEQSDHVAPQEFVDRLPADVAAVWDEYCAVVESKPVKSRPLQRWAGHCVSVPSDEAHLITAAGIREALLIGTADQLIHRLDALESAGVDQLMIQPPLSSHYESTERFARLVMTNL